MPLILPSSSAIAFQSASDTYATAQRLRRESEQGEMKKALLALELKQRQLDVDREEHEQRVREDQARLMKTSLFREGMGRSAGGAQRGLVTPPSLDQQELARFMPVVESMSTPEGQAYALEVFKKRKEEKIAREGGLAVAQKIEGILDLKGQGLMGAGLSEEETKILLELKDVAQNGVEPDEITKAEELLRDWQGEQQRRSIKINRKTRQNERTQQLRALFPESHSRWDAVQAVLDSDPDMRDEDFRRLIAGVLNDEPGEMVPPGQRPPAGFMPPGSQPPPTYPYPGISPGLPEGFQAQPKNGGTEAMPLDQFIQLNPVMWEKRVLPAFQEAVASGDEGAARGVLEQVGIDPDASVPPRVAEQIKARLAGPKRAAKTQEEGPMQVHILRNQLRQMQSIRKGLEKLGQSTEKIDQAIGALEERIGSKGSP